MTDPTTIERDLIVKSPLTVPSSLLLLDLSIKILRTIQLLRDEGADTPRIVQTLLTVLTSDYGPEVIKHLEEHKAYTYGELERTLGVSKSAMHYITNRLISIKMVLMVKVEKPPGLKTPGPAPIVWLLNGAPPEKAGECIIRHYRIFDSVKINLQELIEKKEEETRQELQEQIDDYAQNVIIYLGKWDQRLQSITKAIQELDIPPELSHEVKERVIDHYADLKKRELRLRDMMDIKPLGEGGE